MAHTDDKDVYGDALQDQDALPTTTHNTHERDAVELQGELPVATSTVARAFQKISMEEQRKQAAKMHSFFMDDDKDFNRLNAPGSNRGAVVLTIVPSTQKIRVLHSLGFGTRWFHKVNPIAGKLLALVGDGDSTCEPDPMVLEVKAADKIIALMPTGDMVEAEIHHTVHVSQDKHHKHPTRNLTLNKKPSKKILFCTGRNLCHVYLLYTYARHKTPSTPCHTLSLVRHIQKYTCPVTSSNEEAPPATQSENSTQAQPSNRNKSNTSSLSPFTFTMDFDDLDIPNCHHAQADHSNRVIPETYLLQNDVI